jgi:hypothetical protein
MAKYLPDIRAGDTLRIKLTYPVGKVLTGYIHRMTLRLDLATAPALLAESTFGDHTADMDNVAYVEAMPVTTHIPTGKYYYAVEAENAAGDVVTLVPPPAEYKDKLLVAPELIEDAP